MNTRTSSTAASGCDTACAAIRLARSDNEVIKAVHGYLGTLDPKLLARIPGSLIMLQMNHARDIAAAAVELARHEATLVDDAPEAAQVKEIAMVLSTAAMRLAMLNLPVDAEQR